MNTAEQCTGMDFALLGHPANYEHLGNLFRHARPNFNAEKLSKHRATLSKFFEWAPSYVAQTPMHIEAEGGRRVTGKLVICTFLPENINSPRQMLMAHRKILEGCKLAKQQGAKVVGLGGFTSIVGGDQGEKLSKEVQVAVTSGNTLTAALALAQMDALFERLHYDLSGRVVAVVGASGDIGRACALALAPRARRLLLVARNQAKLAEVRAELSPQMKAYLSTDILAAAAEADVIVAATSAAQSILTEADLRPGTIVCDIGYPKNLSYAPERREDVLIISGGLAEMPFALDISYYTRLPAPTLMYGCFSEAMILALSGRYESYSVGQWRITPEKMEAILRLACACGFRPAPLYRGECPVTQEELDAFLQHVRSAGEDS